MLAEVKETADLCCCIHESVTSCRYKESDDVMLSPFWIRTIESSFYLSRKTREHLLPDLYEALGGACDWFDFALASPRLN